MSEPIRQTVVLGGGSAGWLTAGLIAADHPRGLEDGVQVTLIESPDVPIIGVGEGTWPTMRETLRRIGLPESEFIACCEASFKQGSKFIGWRDGSAGDSYYHPFMLPEGYFDTAVSAVWQALQTDKPFAQVVGAQPQICERGLAPKQVTTPDYEAVMNYGYHLNAGLFGERLKQHCTEKLGVRYISDHVVSVNAHPDGDIASLVTQHNGDVAGELFIDCSGMRALLLSGYYQVPFISKRHLLFNDRALAVQVPYEQANAPIASATLSTAQEAGWVWDIGLPSRRGVGFVYSSEFTDEADAQQVLRTYLSESVPPERVEALQPRALAFDPGYREEFWHRNCVAVGMSSGFLEPLEASALAMVELSAKMISEELPMTRATMTTVARRFNERFRYRWDRVIDFLKLHYVLSERDSDYWRRARSPDTQPEGLLELMAIWENRSPTRHDFYQTDEVFPAASYEYVLYGMGFRSRWVRTARARADFDRARRQFDKNAQQTQRYLAGLPGNRELIDTIVKHARPTG